MNVCVVMIYKSINRLSAAHEFAVIACLCYLVCFISHHAIAYLHVYLGLFRQDATFNLMSDAHKFAVIARFCYFVCFISHHAIAHFAI